MCIHFMCIRLNFNIMLFNRTFQLRIETDGGTVGMKEAPTSWYNFLKNSENNLFIYSIFLLHFIWKWCIYNNTHTSTEVWYIYMQSRMGHLKTSTHISRNKKGGRILPPFVAKPSVQQVSRLDQANNLLIFEIALSCCMSATIVSR